MHAVRAVAEAGASECRGSNSVVLNDVGAGSTPFDEHAMGGVAGNEVGSAPCNPDLVIVGANEHVNAMFVRQGRQGAGCGADHVSLQRVVRGGRSIDLDPVVGIAGNHVGVQAIASANGI